MMLIKGQEKYAIADAHNMGPSFGNRDLYVPDDCNERKGTNETLRFPSSYNCGDKYKKNQEAYKAFSGAEWGSFFKILEYEVF
jgi:hypothetical protein